MPIYEFYCRPCHTVYSFLAKSTSVKASPVCPKCGDKKLEKQVSRFAISKGLSEPSQVQQDPFANVDDAQMEKLMAEMSSTFGEDGESGAEDPQKMAQLMRKMFDTTGMKPTEAMLEAMSRMEAGEDPDRIDEEMGDLLDAEEPAIEEVNSVAGRLRRLMDRPNIDDGLYDL
ncbi:MAG: zinc ribbon domain-containing protein [Pirellulaceae bacterium]|nr:zinc ribbon domain-containing protein [Pirellulaceae bacterium]